MADDLNKRGPQDRTRINVNEAWEVRWWCSEIGCTEAELRNAVSMVGVMANNVRTYLGK